jgi:GTP-binding protein HflX
MSRRGTTAIVAKRTDEQPISTDEIRHLAGSAGYEVADEVTQVRRADPDTEFGAGAVDRIAERVAAHDADVVVVDGDLDPNRTFALRDRIACEVIDRKRLVIDIFADRAATRRARLEVRLADLRYELPLAEERAKRGEASERMGFKSRGEPPAARIRANYRRRIREIESQLAEIQAGDAQRRRERHEAGLDVVALAGYTNAGKSTLLRRLADDHAVDENADRHADLDTTAESRDQLFTTLDTTTRRVTLDGVGRRLLLTDTVGFVSDLPHWLVESFESTLGAAYDADVVCLVVDAAEDLPTVERKTETSLSVLREYRDGGILPVLNKADVAGDLPAKRERVRELVGTPPAGISALEGENLDGLATRLADLLPDYERVTLRVPNDGDGMSLLSWCYDHGRVADVTYGDAVTIAFEGRADVVAQATGRAESLS